MIQTLSRNNLIILVVIVAAIWLLPLVLNSLWIKVVTSAVIFGLAAAGISVLFAQLGLINLSQIALVGIGGWVLLRLNYATGLPFTISLVAGGIITAIISSILALPALRMRGLYLALVTLMTAGAFQIIFNAFQFPNGGEGFWGVAQQSAGAFRRPLIAQSDVSYLRYVLTVAALCIAVAGVHRLTTPGRAWAMIRQSEANAMAAGIDVTFFKMWAFALSGFMAGIAGGLLAGALQQLDARTFVASDSILLFALAIVGGVYHWLGALIAGLLFKLLPALFNDFGVSADLTLVIFGAALLHAIMTAPRGIAGQILSGFAGLVKHRETSHD
ncbi:MAG: branched-chain amino acid ABC transporter permease [Alphaproteobacteria bacterium]|nr:branched-chain amino acid ABC transporter permease [Alphaproteobacteria bacterium]